MRCKKMVVFLTLCLIFCLLPTIASAARKFARIKGRALKYGIALYQGAPPDNYTYEDLGPVSGEYKGRFYDSAVFTISEAMRNLADNAKEMGANAVINIEGEPKKGAFHYEGKAVVFEELPKK